MSESAENVSVQRSVPKNKRRRRILIFCVVSLLNVGLFVLLWTQLLTPASHSESDPLIGHPAPNFSLAMLHADSGKSELALSNFKGKSIVLNFWASWCTPCKEEAPLLESSWKQVQTRGKDIVFLGIDYRETNSNGKGFLQSYDITYPAVLDGNGSVSTKYGVASLPVTIFINRNGTIVSRESQEITAKLLASNLQLIT